MFFSDFQPNRIMFNIFNINIYWYGFFIFLASLVAFLIYYFLLKKRKKDSSFIANSFLIVFISGFLGTRLGYIFLNLNYYFNNPLEIFSFSYGGMAILFGITLSFITYYLFCLKNKYDFWNLLNFFAIPLCVAQIIGRWGNYFNMELYGVETKLPWGILIEGSYHHPLFLYEILANIFILILISFFYKKTNEPDLKKGFYKITNVKDFKKSIKKYPFFINGGIFFIYLNLYLFFRFFIEFLKPDYKYFNLTSLQYVILIMMIVFNLLFFKHIKNEK
ncbi:prolipoprotein diacylglyceryl transferase [Patescibacteria group bacterium]|nr:prolipoprotein diacylglyceryl transferase [Patescibacteria group bacterium]